MKNRIVYVVTTIVEILIALINLIVGLSSHSVTSNTVNIVTFASMGTVALTAYKVLLFNDCIRHCPREYEVTEFTVSRAYVVVSILLGFGVTLLSALRLGSPSSDGDDDANTGEMSVTLMQGLYMMLIGPCVFLYTLMKYVQKQVEADEKAAADKLATAAEEGSATTTVVNPTNQQL